MGPAATVDFLARLVAATPAARDGDHLRILVDCDPRVPDRNRAVAGEGPSPAPALATMARGLVRQGAELLAMPCNAAHAWADAIRAAAAPVPLVSMIEAAGAGIVQAHPGARVGLLAADACLAAGLYQPRLADPVTLGPADQARFMALLYRIKAGGRGADVRDAMRDLGLRLVAGGAQVVLAACTEVPLVLAADALPVPLADATELLVRQVVASATG